MKERLKHVWDKWGVLITLLTSPLWFPFWAIFNMAFIFFAVTWIIGRNILYLLGISNTYILLDRKGVFQTGIKVVARKPSCPK